MRPVLILGGYGNFGKRIAKALVRKDVPVIIAGRDQSKANMLKEEIDSSRVTTASFDAFTELGQALQSLQPSVVINTCGPFQTSDYSIAECCIAHRVHYIDLADGRDFVTGVSALDAQARTAGVAVISGASTVPALSSAVVEQFKAEFAEVTDMTFGISPGQKAERGLATTQGILSYVGKPLKPFKGEKATAYGWQDIYRQDYPEIGSRWMANCDIPDLDLFPGHYGIKSIRFSAGLELGILHLGLWALSWLVRFGLPLGLPRFAAPLLKISNVFDGLGSADGGMHVILTGKTPQGKPHMRKWFIIAFDGDGPHIPTIPAIILGHKLAADPNLLTGALPCMGLISLDDYMSELSAYPIRTYTE